MLFFEILCFLRYPFFFFFCFYCLRLTITVLKDIDFRCGFVRYSTKQWDVVNLSSAKNIYLADNFEKTIDIFCNCTNILVISTRSKLF